MTKKKDKNACEMSPVHLLKIHGRMIKKELSFGEDRNQGERIVEALEAVKDKERDPETKKAKGKPVSALSLFRQITQTIQGYAGMNTKVSPSICKSDREAIWDEFKTDLKGMCSVLHMRELGEIAELLGHKDSYLALKEGPPKKKPSVKSLAAEKKKIKARKAAKAKKEAKKKNKGKK